MVILLEVILQSQLYMSSQFYPEWRTPISPDLTALCTRADRDHSFVSFDRASKSEENCLRTCSMLRRAGFTVRVSQTAIRASDVT
jgi:hypothetical protein